MRSSQLSNNDPDDYDELDIQTWFERPRLIKASQDIDELSDEIKLMLFLAREKALRKYDEVHQLA